MFIRYHLLKICIHFGHINTSRYAAFVPSSVTISSLTVQRMSQLVHMKKQRLVLYSLQRDSRTFGSIVIKHKEKETEAIPTWLEFRGI